MKTIYLIYNYGTEEYLSISNKQEVEKYFTDHNEEIKIEKNTHITQNESSVHMKKEIFCTEYETSDQTQNIYLFRYEESGGGGSYHDIFSVYIFETRQEAIQDAINSFTSEHNHHNDWCEEYMSVEDCINLFRSEITNNNQAYPEDCYMECSFRIIELPI